MPKQFYIIFSFLIFNLLTVNANNNSVNGYKGKSVLTTGKWYKFKVVNNGIYKLTFDDIKNLGFSDPSNIAVYGYTGGILSLINNGNTPDDLEEIPLKYFNGPDNIFNNGDYLIFYARGPNVWSFDKESGLFKHQKNVFSNYAYYFISDVKKGKAVQVVNSLTSAITNEVDQFNDFIFHELDTVNLIQSGRNWYGESFLLTQAERTFDFNFPNLIKSGPISFEAVILGRSSAPTSFTIKANSVLLGNTPFSSVSTTDQTRTYADVKYVKSIFSSVGDNISISLKYNNVYNDDKGYLDFIRINCKRQLTMNGNIMAFRDTGSVGSGNVSRFNLKNSSSVIKIWDITDIHNILEINYNLNGADLQFVVRTDSLREFVAFNNQSYLTPILNGTDVGFISNQNLHGLNTPDYLIIAHNKFTKYADELADFHRNISGLDVQVVDQEKIFNEFSSGARDVSALRNFVKMLYEKGDKTKLKYLLLFGDGSYDNKNFHEKNYNYILTYQSENSINPGESFVCDDFYGLLDNNEDIKEGDLEIGIGRFPVSDTSQARTMVDKVKLYMDKSTYGDWRNNICFIGDDEDSNEHIENAETLAIQVNNIDPRFNENKIYLDAYKQVSTSVGARYPDVNTAIFNQLKRGALIVNYTGHGAEFGLAHEKILTSSDVNNWTNWGKFPVFMTATCEFSRFDYVKFDEKNQYTNFVTTGEKVVLHDKGGAIASLTTTRLVYSSLNLDLNKQFYNYAFKRDTITGERLRLGDIIKFSKNNTPSTFNNRRNFSLLGDPALIINYPEHKIVVDSINGKSVESHADTLGALSYVTIAGHIETKDSEIYNDFNGVLYASVYDKIEKINTLVNDPKSKPFEFDLQNNLLFKGKASVNNGNFRVSFYLPKDISYLKGNGKISLYAYNEETDASGCDFSLAIGGFNNDQVFSDNTGPEIELYINDSLFRDNGISSESPVLFARLFDESGINTATSGIGHEITAVLDGMFSRPIILNDFYETEIDNFQKGNVNYPLLNLEPGEHAIVFKAWDVNNNSNEEEISFVVKESSHVVLNNVYNYPNPLQTSTTFMIEHNMAGNPVEVLIYIYDLSGQLQKTLKSTDSYNGFFSPAIDWDGSANNGNYLQNGMYIYKVILKTEKGVAEKSSKLMIIR